MLTHKVVQSVFCRKVSDLELTIENTREENTNWHFILELLIINQ